MLNYYLRMAFRYLNRNNRIFLLLLSIIAFKYLIIFCILHLCHNSNSTSTRMIQKVEKYSNFFLEFKYSKNWGFLLETNGVCNIPNISAWDQSISHLIQKLPEIDCNLKNRHWTYVNGTNLVMNKSAIEDSGYTLSTISCCFYSILRITESKGKYTWYADRKIKISDKCTTLIEVSTFMNTNEYIKVVCSSKWLYFSYLTLYRQFHIIALPQKDSKTRKKLHFWYPPRIEIPPNVLILGIDSMSRLSFIRNMPKTREILEKIGGIEFLGYGKVGENTFPNNVAHLTGYTVEDLADKKCHYESRYQDSCPYIWKEFEKFKYFTALIEDIPLISAFNYWKVGFVKKPVDFYYRPFNLALEEYNYHTKWDKLNPVCNGYEKFEDTFMNYIEDLMKMSENSKVPIFINSWLSSLAHNDINGAQLGDDKISDFLSRLQLNNTVLIFMSDHGYRYGEIRNTFSGWLEDKLPNLWFVLSPDLEMRYPYWKIFLKLNSRKLTTPYDIYQTLRQILKETSQNKKHKSVVKRNFGQSLISTQVSNLRNCSDAGIPEIYCPCSIPQKVSLNDETLLRAANEAITKLNDQISPLKICQNFALKYIFAGGKILTNNSNREDYIVDFVAGPGEFHFEAYVQHFKYYDFYSVFDKILRTNGINSDVSCIHRNHTLILDFEQYCYCSDIPTDY